MQRLHPEPPKYFLSYWEMKKEGRKANLKVETVWICEGEQFSKLCQNHGYLKCCSTSCSKRVKSPKLLLQIRPQVQTKSQKAIDPTHNGFFENVKNSMWEYASFPRKIRKGLNEQKNVMMDLCCVFRKTRSESASLILLIISSLLSSTILFLNGNWHIISKHLWCLSIDFDHRSYWQVKLCFILSMKWQA